MAFQPLQVLKKFFLLALSLSCQVEILPVNQLTLVLALAVTLEKELSFHYVDFIAFLQTCLPAFSGDVHTRFGPTNLILVLLIQMMGRSSSQ